MKYINKNNEPQKLLDYKNLESEEWSPTYSNIDKDVKEQLHLSLLTEQGYICCYCERRISIEDSHIEHLDPQSKSPEKALDYNNLLSSCQKHLKKGEPLHCGNLKDDWYDTNLFISPLDHSCEDRFSYKGDGSIIPKEPDDKAAKETISKLGLDINKLNALRSNVLATYTDTDLTNEEFLIYLQKSLVKDNDGKYHEFWTMLNNIFNNK
jgi:uncharacterized protein (TIGR02646 family)